MLKVLIAPVTPFQQNCSIVWDDQTMEGTAVDPGGDFELLQQAIDEQGIKVTTVLLTRSLGEYHAIARSRGLVLFNPAFYDPGRNQVVCGSDLEKLCDELQAARKHHEEWRARLRESKDELKKVYKGKPPAALLEPLVAAEKRIDAREKKNDETFAAVTSTWILRAL